MSKIHIALQCIISYSSLLMTDLTIERSYKAA